MMFPMPDWTGSAFVTVETPVLALVDYVGRSGMPRLRSPTASVVNSGNLLNQKSIRFASSYNFNV
jgi:hypothetical protein